MKKFIKITFLLIFILLLVVGIITGDMYSNRLESSTL